MRAFAKSVWVALTWFALGGMAPRPAHAQTSLEDFQRLASQLRQTPKDTALREQVIKRAQTLKPPPAIPEEARKPFIMGATVLKKASGPADAAKAAELFTTAINLAPWFSDAYYNRAVARETAGQFELAMGDLKLYLLFKLSDQERREVQDKIYALEADAQLAATKKVEEEKARLAAAAAERERTRPTIEGAWNNGWLVFRVIRDGERYRIVEGTMLGIKPPITWRAADLTGDHQRLDFQGVHDNPGIRLQRFELALSTDGQELTGRSIGPRGEIFPQSFRRVP